MSSQLNSSDTVYRNRSVFFHYENEFVSCEKLNHDFAHDPFLACLNAMDSSTTSYGDQKIAVINFKLIVSDLEINPFKVRLEKIKAIVSRYVSECTIETTHTCTVMHGRDE